MLALTFDEYDEISITHRGEKITMNFRKQECYGKERLKIFFEAPRSFDIQRGKAGTKFNQGRQGR